MRPSASLLITIIALTATAQAIEFYVWLKRKYSDPSPSIRAALKAAKGCNCDIEREGLPGPTNIDEEYRILSMLLNDRVGSIKNRGPIVVSVECDFNRVGYRLDPACREREAWADLAWKDQNIGVFENRFKPGVPFILLSRDEMSEMFKSQDGWGKFYERYPDADGIRSLSRVGFSRRGDIAIVRMGLQSHELSGFGGTYVLVRTRDGWKVRGTRGRWVS